jgi:Fur family ferric uptake transcriptional regulator
VDELHSTVATRLRRIGQRYTSGRRALVEAIVEADRPVTTAELVSARPSLPQSTTYRNLAVLEQAGVVHRVLGSDEYARFELSEELGGHHHHLVCVHCGNVEDFTPPPRFERSLAAVIGNVTTGTGFRAQTHRLDLLGTCGACTP